MGALTIGFMATEEIKITSVQFTGTNVVISVSNQGTSGVTISEVSINGQTYTATYNPSSQTINANGHATITVTRTLGRSATAIKSNSSPQRATCSCTPQ